MSQTLIQVKIQNPNNEIEPVYIAESLFESNTGILGNPAITYLESDGTLAGVDLSAVGSITLDEDSSQYVLTIEKDSSVYQSTLKDTNFYIELGDVFVSYKTDPSEIKLTDIAIVDKTIDGELIESDGILTDTGVELWEGNTTVLEVNLDRIYYRGDEIQITDDSSLSSALELAKTDNARKIYLEETQDTTDSDTVAIGFNGVFLKFGDKEGTTQVQQNYSNYVLFGSNESVVFENGIFDSSQTFKLYNANPLFKNCTFVDCTFNVSCWSSVRFFNCSFENCQFIGDNSVEHDSIARNSIEFISSTVYNCTIDSVDSSFYKTVITSSSISKTLHERSTLLRAESSTFKSEYDAATVVSDIDTIMLKNCALNYDSTLTYIDEDSDIYQSVLYIENCSDVDITSCFSEYLNDGTYFQSTGLNFSGEFSAEVKGCALGKIYIEEDSSGSLILQNCTLLDGDDFGSVQSLDTSIFANCSVICREEFPEVNEQPKVFLNSIKYCLNDSTEFNNEVCNEYNSTSTGTYITSQYSFKDLNPSISDEVITDGTIRIYTFQKESGKFSHLNNCLKFISTSYYQEGTIYSEYQSICSDIDEEILEASFPTKDILGNTRANIPLVGITESDLLLSSVIPLYDEYYKNARDTFNSLYAYYQNPWIKDEYYVNDDPLGTYCIDIYKDGVLLNESYTLPTEEWAEQFGFCVDYLYNADIEDDGTVITFKLRELSTEESIQEVSTTLNVANSPVLEYTSESVTAWTGVSGEQIVLEATVSNVAYDEETISVLGSYSFAWYKVSSNGDTELIQTTGLSWETDDDDNIDIDSLYTRLVISDFTSATAGKYICVLTYTPENYETSIDVSGTYDGEESYITVIVREGIVIDNDNTTNGTIKVRLNEELYLSGVLLAGESPWYKWQKTNTPDDEASWMDIIDLNHESSLYSEIQSTESNNYYYYRFYACNYVDNDNTEIATEAYSDPWANLLILPAEETTSTAETSVTLVKVPFTALNSEEIAIDDNYRVFNTIQNADEVDDSSDTTTHPVLHRRTQEELWSAVDVENDLIRYKRNYKKFEFPTDLDIDKTNENLGACTESVSLDSASNICGGNLYVLDLENLNDDYDSGYNKPLASINCIESLSTVTDIERLNFEKLGYSVFMNNGYIAVGDPCASLLKDYENECTQYEETDLEFDSDGVCKISITAEKTYQLCPYITVYKSSDSIEWTSVQFSFTWDSDSNTAVITITDTSLAGTTDSENTYKILFLGNIYEEESDLLQESLTYNELSSNSSWIFEYTSNFEGTPLIQIINSDGELVEADITLRLTSKTGIVTFADSNITVGEYTIYLTGKNASSELNYYNTETYKKTFTSDLSEFVWELELSNNNLTAIPMVQVTDINGNLIEADISYNSDSNTLTITTDKDTVGSYTLLVNVFTVSYSKTTVSFVGDSEYIYKHSGRVLLYYYNKNTNLIELIKIIKSPNEQNNGAFGSYIEFDDYGNILICAPGEITTTAIGYNLDLDTNTIIPVKGAETTIDFESLGKVYVYSLSALKEGDITDTAEAKQSLSNNYIFSTVDYANESFGLLSNYFSVNYYYVIYDTETSGEKYTQSFNDYSDYVEFYNFNAEYDFVFKALFPEIYTEDDFKSNNSNSTKYSIEYTAIISKKSINDFYAKSLSSYGRNLVVNAPEYNSNNGLIEFYYYNKELQKYEYKNTIVNPVTGNSTFWGLNTECSENYVLCTYKTHKYNCVRYLTINSNKLLVNSDITIYPDKKTALGSTFGIAMDSDDTTFVISSTAEGKIYRYKIIDSELTLLQTIDISGFIIDSKRDSIVITGDKILCAYKSFSDRTSYQMPQGSISLYTNSTEEITKYYSSTASGAVLQLNLIGNSFVY